MEKTMRKAKISEILKYGLGGVGSNVAFMLVMAYLMFFYTDVFGINAAAVGGLFFVTRFIDAITDPMMGMIADRTRSKYGKFRVWVLFGAPLLGLTVAMMFAAPDLSPTGKLIYVYVTYIAYSLISTIVNIPYHSLTPVLSQDPDQRTVIATTKQLLGQFGNAFVTIGAIPLVTMLGGGARAWQIYGIASGIIIVIAFYFCAWGAKNHDVSNVVTKESTSENKPKLTFKKQMALILKNRALLMLMIAFGTDMIAFAAANATNIYYFTYAVKRPDLIPVIGLFALVIGVPITFTIPSLSKRFGKKRLFTIASTTLIAISSWLFFIPFENSTLILVQAAILAAVSPFTGVIGWAMLADCVEYGEWVTGIRGEGTVSSQLTFVNKLGMALGGILAGMMLSAVGYVAGGEQSASVLRAIVGIKALLPAAGYVCSVIAMFFYPITKEFYYQMIEDNRNNHTGQRNQIEEIQASQN